MERPDGDYIPTDWFSYRETLSTDEELKAEMRAEIISLERRKQYLIDTLERMDAQDLNLFTDL